MAFGVVSTEKSRKERTLTPDPFPNKNGEGEQRSLEIVVSYPPHPLSGTERGTELPEAGETKLLAQ